MNWWEDQINNPDLAIIHKTPEEIMREGLEHIEKTGNTHRRYSAPWHIGFLATNALDKAYGKERN
ncbi:hypothetical protein J2T12_005091 [Paenibacillus anaericanus]|uniref:hypothetical protein n=1 Tax=Paenibacillus anaericanus TaxID=170367 RepID=UPI0027862BFF|nr:hypothetical protein [Paenibacillus anaericanus]MDQ0091651.1 hypothetical protein [Paenibacillus anaericanus]